ncbi:MAG: UDP-N-acetylmuramoyl-L-alanyl-D-glutamate--2,6-diaminopimelate ligase [Casimicrobiaceae bacterium]
MITVRADEGMRVTPHFEAEALLAALPVGLEGITADSRHAAPAIAFAAYPGTRRDGRDFIDDAIARGAAAVLWESDGYTWDAHRRVPQVGVAGLRERVGPIASAVYGHPSRALWMAGVTGTNGKTSCAHWIAQTLTRCGRRAAVIGTLGNGLVGHPPAEDDPVGAGAGASVASTAVAEARSTTPDACELHALLARWRAQGATAVAMEVSSHGLDQGRVNGVAFKVALFTNLTRDHLDYHGTMEAYAVAKQRLFDWPGLECAIINAGDAFGRELIARLRARHTRVLTYGTRDADIVALRVDATPAGMAMEIATPSGGGTLTTRIAGAFNVDNLLGVTGVLLASGVPLSNALAALAEVGAPPGRMERLGGGVLPTVVIDYAHTPDALLQVLTALRPAVGIGGALVCVFGCGGDRDRGKRGEMGAIAAAHADRVIVTSDNPRSEDPRAIADDIAAGVPADFARITIDLDRMHAVTTAIAVAQPGDVVAVAGKGHEPYQEIAGVRRPYSDRAVVAAALAQWSHP